VTKKDLISYRLAEAGDVNFILSTWLKGMTGGNDYYRMINRESFNYHYGEFIKRRMAKQGVLIMVACLKESPDVILGYSVTERVKNKNVLHWVYVKKEWRRIGIAKDILPSEINVTTSMTALGKKIKPKGLVFDPFL